MNILILLVVSCVFIHHIDCGKYIKTNDTTYFFSYPMLRNWYEAQRYCAYNGMYFLSIHTYDENEVILAAIQEVKTHFNLDNSTFAHFWAGATDTGVATNEFFWVTTGYPIVFKNWLPGYPANNIHPSFNKTSMDCLLLYANEYKWYDEHCLASYSFICQDKLHLPKTLDNKEQCNEQFQLNK